MIIHKCAISLHPAQFPGAAHPQTSPPKLVFDWTLGPANGTHFGVLRASDSWILGPQVVGQWGASTKMKKELPGSYFPDALKRGVISPRPKYTHHLFGTRGPANMGGFDWTSPPSRTRGQAPPSRPSRGKGLDAQGGTACGL